MRAREVAVSAVSEPEKKPDATINPRMERKISQYSAMNAITVSLVIWAAFP